MTVSVTMLQTRMGEDGNLWTVAGSPYTASLEFANFLIGNRFATGTLPTAVQSYPMTQVVATAAEIAAITGQPGVRYVERDGDQREFRWVGGEMVQVGGASASSGAFEQFGVVQSGLSTTPYRMSASGTPAGLSGPCLVTSIMCITVGTTTPPSIHDDVDAADAEQLRWTRAIANLTAGQNYSLAGDGAAVIFVNGVYFTNSTGGVYIINAVPEAV